MKGGLSRRAPGRGGNLERHKGLGTRLDLGICGGAGVVCIVCARVCFQIIMHVRPDSSCLRLRVSL